MTILQTGISANPFITAGEDIRLIVRPAAGQPAEILDGYVVASEETLLKIQVGSSARAQCVLAPEALVYLAFRDSDNAWVEFATSAQPDPVEEAIGTVWVTFPEASYQFFRARRRYVRIACHLPVQVTQGENALRGMSVNLGAGGMRLMLTDTLQTAQPLKLLFSGDTLSGEFEVAGEAVRLAPNWTAASRELFPILASVRFVHPNRAAEDRLMGFCFRHEMLQHRLGGS